MPRQVAGNGTLSRSGRTVNGDDDLACRIERAGGRITHPRFFVPLFGRAVKPNRLLFPAFVPAARVVFRLPPGRAGRAVVLESLLRGALPLPAALAVLAWPPFRELHAGPEGLAERVPEAPLVGRPAGRALLLDPFLLVEAVPLRLPFVPEAVFGFQRAAEAGRAPLAVREPAGRESAPVRRAGRLLEEDCAGLRSRE